MIFCFWFHFITIENEESHNWSNWYCKSLGLLKNRSDVPFLVNLYGENSVERELTLYLLSVFRCRLVITNGTEWKAIRYLGIETETVGLFVKGMKGPHLIMDQIGLKLVQILVAHCLKFPSVITHHPPPHKEKQISPRKNSNLSD
jgi:hypothetical protein